jgi:type I restriction enzyme S subunit
MSAEASPLSANLPAHWDVRSLGSVLRRRSERRGGADLPLLSVVRSKGVVLRASMSEDENHNYIPDDLSNYQVVKRGDLAINKMKAWQGSLGISRIDGVVSPAYYVFRLFALDLDYAHWLLRSRLYADLLARASDGVRIGQWDLSIPRMKAIPIPIPPSEEQQHIASFLTSAVSRIDEAIATKNKLIELLEEERQAIIAAAVALGVDPSAELAEAEVPWLDRVPAHWIPLRAKYLYTEVDERSSTGTEERLSVSHLTGVTPRSEKTITMFEAETYVGHKICRPGDMVINTMWAWMGALGVSRHTGLVSPSYGVYRPKSNGRLDSAYADALLRTPMAVSEYTRRSTGIHSSRLRLYPDAFLDMTFYLPPHAEQQQIVKHAASEIKGIDEQARHARRQIELLEEYRMVLIDDAVTGKIDLTSENSRPGDTVAEEVVEAASARMELREDRHI